MGRPPIGRKAMTPTERFRRWQAKHGKTGALFRARLELTQRREQIAVLRAQVHALRAQLRQARAE
jgi:hypothetical protein